MQSSRTRHRSDSINQRFASVRQRILHFKPSAPNSRSNTSIHPSDVQMLNSSQLSNDFDVDMRSSIINSPNLNEVNIDMVLRSSTINSPSFNEIDMDVDMGSSNIISSNDINNERIITSTPLPEISNNSNEINNDIIITSTPLPEITNNSNEINYDRIITSTPLPEITNNMNEINNDRNLTSTPLPRNTNAFFISHSPPNVS